MGDRSSTSSPRHGQQRNGAKEREAREHYKTRAERRPKQYWHESLKMWYRQGQMIISGPIGDGLVVGVIKLGSYRG